LLHRQIPIIASLYHNLFLCILCFVVVTLEVSFFSERKNGDKKLFGKSFS
jgi:hypothetical protein